MAEPLKKIYCIGCPKIIAEGEIQRGVIAIICRHCGTVNKIEAHHKTEKPVIDVPYGDRIRYGRKAS